LPEEQRDEAKMTDHREDIAAQQPRRTAGRVIRLFVLLVATIVVAVPVATTLMGMLSQDKLDPYSLYMDAASLAKEPIENKSEPVPVVATSRRSFEEELSAKLTKLEDAVESATALGFFRRGRDTNGEVLALAPRSESVNPESGQLAAILDDPALLKKGTPKKRGSRANIGGSEAECGDALCTFGVKKEDVVMQSFTDDALTERRDSNLTEHQRQLRQRLEHALAVMRALPLGSPADGEISSEFGYRRSPFSRRASFHEGIDVSLRRGNRVVATGGGIVERVAYNRTYGTVIDVKHAPGLVTRYAHLTKSLVKQGQHVQRGELIALSGNTGRSTGPHLHYEVLFHDRPRDPRPFIELADELAEW
jgi:murein DD-endopeptidase MepM/ murein hydrolase activator NlpD